GFSTSLGGSIGLTHLPNCGGTHVHGTFNGFADPMSGGCGHGIIQLIVPPPPVSGGSSLVSPAGSFPGGMPTNVAGQLALTTPRGGIPQGLSPDVAGDAFMLAVAGFGLELVELRERLGRPGLSAIGDFWREDGREIDAQIFYAADSMQHAVDRIIRSEVRAGAAGTPPVKLVQSTLANPAQNVLTSPATLSILEEFA